MYSGKKSSVFWVPVLIVLWYGEPAPAQSRTESAVVVDLHSYGWEGPNGREINSPSLAIDHQGRVLVSFTVRERKGLVTRSEPSLDFRIVRFLPDGKVDLSLLLATNEAGRTGIYLSDTDQIIARANESLQLLHTDEGSPQGGAWKILAPCALHCYVEQSVTRRTLHLYTIGADPASTLIRLSQQPLLKPCGKAEKLIGANDEKVQNYPQSITDEFAYFSLDGGAYRWPLCDYEHRAVLPVPIRGRWIALSDKLFVLNTLSREDNWGLAVISSDGHPKFRPDLAKHESVVASQPIRSSEQGDRVAVDIATLGAGKRRLDISAHATARRIAVYDIEAGKEVASIPASVKHRYRLEFDLSPDGHRFAILEDGTLKVVSLD